MQLLALRLQFFTAMVLAACAAVAAEPIGTGFTYQGQLKEQGVPLDGDVDLLLSLFDVESDGVALDMLELANVSVASGLFTVELDFGAEVFNGDARWVEVAVRSPHDPTSTEPFTTLTPRQPLTATPYALQTRGLFVDEDGNVGIGTNDPLHPLHVETSNVFAVYGRSTSTAGRGVSGYATADSGETFGGRFEAYSTAGIAVFGRATAASGTNYGVRGKTNSSDGYAGYFEGGRNYFQGRVGIGTNSPGSDVKLHLGGANANIRIYESGGSPYVEIGDNSTDRGYLQWFSSTDRLMLYTSGHDYPVAIGPTATGGVFVDTETNSSRVGIGTESPSFKLHVNGSAGKPGGGSWTNSSDRRLISSYEAPFA